MKRKAELKLENKGGICYVVVLDKYGKESFRREKTEQTIAIANSIYMYEEYHEIDEQKRAQNKIASTTIEFET